jgi:hypothetical protein
MNLEKALLLAMVACAVALFARCAPAGSAQQEPAPAMLRAQRIELVDEHGVVRARLNTEDDGTVMFRLFDSKGDIRVKLGASQNGSGLILANETAQPGVHVLAQDVGSSIKLASAGMPERVITP